MRSGASTVVHPRNGSDCACRMRWAATTRRPWAGTAPAGTSPDGRASTIPPYVARTDDIASFTCSTSGSPAGPSRSTM
ncbi:Uncharacterised protein [Mycobacteroides abscessus]|nr:Uncharacterised protein [Mycobacteroides abscessus]